LVEFDSPQASHARLTVSPLISGFQRQVRQQPAAIAICDGVTSASYAELDEAARRLLRRLRQRGVERGEVIGICLDRGIDFVVAQLAVLSAKAICLPIDPGAPVDSSRQSLSATHARYVIGRPGPREAWGEGLVWMDPSVGTEDAIEPAADESDADGTDVGFILFTSGSTGTPKGVCIRQESVIHLVCDTDYVQLGPTDVIMQGAHVAFDATLFETWGALLNGGRLEVIPKSDLLHPERLGQFLADRQVTVAFLTTSLFNLAGRHVPTAFKGLRYLVVGGEVMDPTAAGQVIHSGHSPEKLLNAYGPTETTTFATFQVVTPACLERSSVPIGRPLRRSRCYVLDGQRRPVADGDVGEIWIGGPGVSAGYWEMPVQTAERFCPDPWNREAGGMMYATGDLGRRGADGVLEFLGRRDGQLKVRGIRVEVVEVEAILREHAAVADVAVVPERDGVGVRRLVAFVQWSDAVRQERLGAAVGSDSLLAWMRARAAAHLVPAMVIPVERLPRTSSGKLDRHELERRLTAEATNLPAVGRPAELTASAAERVRGVWKALLRRDEIPPQANFFVLGGDSLEAVKMLLQVESIVGRGISLADWLEDPTVESLIRLGTMDKKLPGPRIYLLEYLFWLGNQDLPGLTCTMLPFGQWGTTTENSSVSHIVQNCLARLQPELGKDDYILVGYSMAGFVAIELAAELTAQGRPPQDVWLVDSVPPTWVHRRCLQATSWLGRCLRLPMQWRLQLGRASHSIAEVVFELTRGRLWDAAVRMWEESRIAVGFVGRRTRPSGTGQGGSNSHSRPSNFHAICWAHDAYMPSDYGGPVACFLTTPTRHSRWAPDFGWAAALSEPRIVAIPGTHSSCIRGDRGHLLAAFRQRLQETVCQRPETVPPPGGPGL
jgi:amino acid adenylation domain-containing protein